MTMVAVLVVGRGVGAAGVIVVVVVVVAGRFATVIATGPRVLVEASAVADVAEIGRWGVGGVGVFGVVSWLGVAGLVSWLGVAGLVDVALGLPLAVVGVRHAKRWARFGLSVYSLAKLMLGNVVILASQWQDKSNATDGSEVIHYSPEDLLYQIDREKNI